MFDRNMEKDETSFDIHSPDLNESNRIELSTYTYRGERDAEIIRRNIKDNLSPEFLEHFGQMTRLKVTEIYKVIRTVHFPGGVEPGNTPVMIMHHSLFNKYYNFTRNKATHIEQNIFYECFKRAFSLWEGWTRLSVKNMCVEKICYELYLYLDKNVKFINNTVSDQIPLMKFTKNPSNNYLNVDCSYIKLKQYFYHCPDTVGKTFSWNTSILYNGSTVEPIVPNLLINWPYISIKLTLPGFEISHQNFHVNCFNVLSLNNAIDFENYELQIPKHDGMLCRSGTPVTYPTAQVKRYITELKSCLKSKEDLKNSRNEILHQFLTEFQRDLNFCGDTIQSKLVYNFNVMDDPYVRFLGNTGTLTPQITTSEQMSLEPQTLNVRLQQFVLPMVKFDLINFNPLLHNFEVNHFINAIKGNCLIYTCTLCSIQYTSFLAVYELCQHLSDAHGIEPDWTCSKCRFSFSNRHLVANRWIHSCTNTNAAT